jgi:hypothetical protein
MSQPNDVQLRDIIKNIPNFTVQNLDNIIPISNGSVRLAMIYADNLWFSLLNNIKKALFKSIPAGHIIPIQALKDKASNGTVTYSEYLSVFHLICVRAISDNAKFATTQGHHAAAFASGVIFDKIHYLFITAEEYNFTAYDVIMRVVACLDYYHYVKQTYFSNV